MRWNIFATDSDKLPASDAPTSNRMAMWFRGLITFGEMRSMGVRGVLIYCADYQCGYSVALLADRWTDDVRLSDVEPHLVCSACGKRGADVRPNFDRNAKGPIRGMGYRVASSA